MNREEIQRLIPHREPMLLVDEVEMNGAESVSKYTIRDNEFFTQGHFPDNPIVPGVILCEMMAQGSALLLKDCLQDHLALYAGVTDTRFLRVVRPGDTVVTRGHLVTKRGPLVIIEAMATVNNQLCCKGRLSFMLTPKPNNNNICNS
ncbi:MAG: beta-hydroxyacyl-ACP dehydratase [Paludibacteraceae bacterium]|nr:beta-hydroxyacyl-ACP dehydratase [Paludibacteraceae bacterium]